MPDDEGRTTVGIVHPGSMGAAVGASAVAAGAHGMWVSEGRSDASRERAERAGLEDVHWLNGLVSRADIILSICPPSSALEVAEDVGNLGFHGVYVDANAVSPDTARRVEEQVERFGAGFVDGSIIGGPPWKPGVARLYLAGDEAERVSRAFEGGPLEVRVLDAPAGSASALKMAYAGWTKGTSALLTAVQALAIREGVLDALYAEWDEALRGRAEDLGRAAAKAWRWTGEMDEIAATFEAAGLPPGFHEAAAEVYRRLEAFKDDPSAPGGAELARHLLPE